MTIASYFLIGYLAWWFAFGKYKDGPGGKFNFVKSLGMVLMFTGALVSLSMTGHPISFDPHHFAEIALGLILGGVILFIIGRRKAKLERNRP